MRYKLIVRFRFLKVCRGIIIRSFYSFAEMNEALGILYSSSTKQK